MKEIAKLKGIINVKCIHVKGHGVDGNNLAADHRARSTLQTELLALLMNKLYHASSIAQLAISTL